MPKREWSVPEDTMVITQSTVGSMELSPCRVIAVPDGLRTFTSEPMFGGTVPHAIIEEVVTGQADRLKAMSVKHILEVAEEALEFEAWPGTLAALVGDPMEWASGLSALIAEWWTGPWSTEVRHMDLIEAEVPRWKMHPYGKLPHTERNLAVATGGIDFIGRDPERGIVGIDWKTTGRQWYQNAGGGRIQHQLYDFLVMDEYEVDEWVYWVGDRSTNKWEPRKAKVTERSRAAALDRVWQWAVYLDDPDRPYLCTPSDGKSRGWWAKPQYNHGWCLSCRYLGDGWDTDWEGVEAQAVDGEGRLVTYTEEELRSRFGVTQGAR